MVTKVIQPFLYPKCVYYIFLIIFTSKFISSFIDTRVHAFGSTSEMKFQLITYLQKKNDNT